MKFGGKPTMREKAKAVETRLGATTGVSKGSKPASPAKAKPVLGKDKVGIKVTKKF